ncbi:hypothetical protein [Streptomyces kebangsaanensis]|uniref:hypothetical protein n=1 Tax=Streptomyces kebangsaanensis TaxID=864058 RepID=UPI002D21D0FA|nr:hypothetical protein [Streptomyces kebangsaanensis]
MAGALQGTCVGQQLFIQNFNETPIETPDPPEVESAHWYYYYLLTERGAVGLAKNTKEFARAVWKRNSPKWRFTEADLDRAARMFDNPGYIAVVLNVYRVRRHDAPTDPRYADLEARLLKQPPITVPAVTLDGLADGSLPPDQRSLLSGALHRPTRPPPNPRRRPQPPPGAPGSLHQCGPRGQPTALNIGDLLDERNRILMQARAPDRSADRSRCGPLINWSGCVNLTALSHIRW